MDAKPRLGSRLLAVVAALLVTACSGAGSPTPTRGGPLNNAAIHMIDSRNGWAFGGNLVARTRDGAQTFENVTPRGLPAHAELDRPLFLDADRAFVFAITWSGSKIATSSLEKTSDGGASWQATAMSSAVIGDLTFADPLHGWLVTSQDSADALHITDTLWRTVDGGARWSAIYAYTYRVDVHPSTQPGGCYWEGSIAWISATHGIVGVACPFDAPPTIDVTDDAGTTWTTRILPPLPQRTGVVLFSIVDVARVFAGGQVVADVSRCVGPDGTSCIPYFEVYRSSDGGASWSGGAVYRGGNDPLVSVDPEHSWTVGCIDDACASVGLLATTDGGVRWNVYPMRTELGVGMHGSLTYSFVSAEVGFASATRGLINKVSTAYFTTTDGGRTFKPFEPLLAGQAR